MSKKRHTERCIWTFGAKHINTDVFGTNGKKVHIDGSAQEVVHQCEMQMKKVGWFRSQKSICCVAVVQDLKRSFFLKKRSKAPKLGTFLCLSIQVLDCLATFWTLR